MGGYHIAEALGIPYFRAFTMTWSRTRFEVFFFCFTILYSCFSYIAELIHTRLQSQSERYCSVYYFLWTRLTIHQMGGSYNYMVRFIMLDVFLHHSLFHSRPTLCLIKSFGVQLLVKLTDGEGTCSTLGVQALTGWNPTRSHFCITSVLMSYLHL